MKKLILFSIILLQISYTTAPAAAWTGKCVGIADGDTITVMQASHPIKIRLYGIDCPERKQPFYQKAKDFTADFAFRKTVRIREVSGDRYGRTVALVYGGDLCLNKELLRAGLAWHYKRYSREQEYADLENEAHTNRIGLWQDKSPEPPWEFRRKKVK